MNAIPLDAVDLAIAATLVVINGALSIALRLGLERDLAIALLRVPRGDGSGGNASLIRALARDCDIDPERFDPLDCEMGAPYDGPRHKMLWATGVQSWRTNGDTVERLAAHRLGRCVHGDG